MTSNHPVVRLVLVLGLVATAVMSQACAAGPSTPPASNAGIAKDTTAKSPAGAGQQDSQSAEDRTLLAVSKAIRRAHLSDRPDECLAYRFDSNTLKTAYLVEVRENHRRASCGGDPQTQPRLFSVRVDKKTQQMSTDADSPGKFHPLSK